MPAVSRSLASVADSPKPSMRALVPRMDSFTSAPKVSDSMSALVVTVCRSSSDTSRRVDLHWISASLTSSRDWPQPPSYMRLPMPLKRSASSPDTPNASAMRALACS